MPESDELRPVLTAISEAVPEGWRRIIVRLWGSIAAYQTEISVTMADGSTPSVELPPLTMQLAKLRRSMYELDRGTWLSARIDWTIRQEPRISFNYDDDPSWWPDLPAIVFAQDLNAYPRSDEHVPTWLRQKLAEAVDSEGPPDVSTDTPRPQR
jgi:hypothetical protein